MACEMCGNRLMIVGTREFFTGDKRHICDNCLRRFKDIESLKKTDLNRALNLIDLLEQDSIKEARPGLDRYKESITKQYNAHKEAEAEQNKRDALEVEKSPDIIVTTCDLKQEYEVIAPVYFQLSNKGVFSSTFSKLSGEYTEKLKKLAVEGQMSKHKADWGWLYGEFSVGQNDFDKAFFIAVEELKKRAARMGADAVIGMRQDIDLDTNAFTYVYLQMYGTAVKFK